MAATNGVVNDSIVLTASSRTRHLIARLRRAATSPTATATPTDQAKAPNVARKEKPSDVPAIAVRSRISALASLSRLSPSRMTATRPGTPRPLMIPTATASVGLRIAPSATPQPKPRPGMSHTSAAPSTSELSTTSTTDKPLIAISSRRKFTTGTDVADAYSNGGSRPIRMMFGSMATSGTAGTRLTQIPANTRMSGAGILSLGASVAAAAITNWVTTSRMMVVCMGSSSYRMSLTFSRAWVPPAIRAADVVCAAMVQAAAHTFPIRARVVAAYGVRGRGKSQLTMAGATLSC
jgi:hypothetical protein